MEIGHRIRELREQKNYTINKLANLAGVSQSYLRDVELENKNPTIAFLSLICQTLDISLKDFFNEKTQTGISDDPIVQAIYRLTPEQKEALLNFLKTLQN
ncbi:MAG: helix-turn-helix transcriptional regulator [Lachnospira sp.]|nr:helix-turn-helix transcriptional regulator [Lachnospira sp.]